MASAPVSTLTKPVSIAQIRDLMRATSGWDSIEKRLRDDTQFADAGMDSLEFLDLVAELQRLAGLEIPDHDVEHISSLRAVQDYLNRRLE